MRRSRVENFENFNFSILTFWCSHYCMKSNWTEWNQITLVHNIMSLKIIFNFTEKGIKRINFYCLSKEKLIPCDSLFFQASNFWLLHFLQTMFFFNAVQNHIAYYTIDAYCVAFSFDLSSYIQPFYTFWHFTKLIF